MTSLKWIWKFGFWYFHRVTNPQRGYIKKYVVITWIKLQVTCLATPIYLPRISCAIGRPEIWSQPPIHLAMVLPILNYKNVSTCEKGYGYHFSSSIWTTISACYNGLFRNFTCVACVALSELLRFMAAVTRAWSTLMMTWKRCLHYRPFLGESTGRRWIPLAKVLMIRSFHMFFFVNPNKLSNKYSNRRLFETLDVTLMG